MIDETRKCKLGVLFGGRSGEHEVSLLSAQSVLQVIDPQKYTVTQIGITHSGAWLTGEDVLGALKSGQTQHLSSAVLLPEAGQAVLYARKGDLLEKVSQLDAIFPILHGSFGEDGTIQGLLELADMAYVGAGVLASALGMDKGVFKDIMRANGVPVVPSRVVTRRQIERDPETVMTMCETLSGYPLFTKPANLGSSVGITRCLNRSDLFEGLLEAARFDRRVLVEKGIVNAREIEVSVLGNEQPQASIPGEIRPADDFYTYNAKYLSGSTGLLIPAPLSPELSEHVRDLAVRTYRAIDGAGMARVDFLLDPSSQEAFVSEINTIPGFTQISMYPKLWEASGISYRDLIDRLIDLAFERKFDRDHTERLYRRGE